MTAATPTTEARPMNPETQRVDAESVPHSEWNWYGMAAHFIGASDCLFHMATEIGGYMISTVGDYRPRECDGSRGDRTSIGFGRDYETFVFKTSGRECGCGCCMPGLDLCEIDSEPANDPATARINHMAMCEKYASRIGAKP
jgi:hypothetical protein